VKSLRTLQSINACVKKSKADYGVMPALRVITDHAAFPFRLNAARTTPDLSTELKRLTKIPLPGRISPNRAERCASWKIRIHPCTRYCESSFNHPLS